LGSSAYLLTQPTTYQTLSVKGFYEKAFKGEIEQFTGVSDPYEPPAAPDLILKTNREEQHESARKVLEKLEFYGYVSPLMEIEEYTGFPEG
jgi:adenylylsulfate kinase